MIDKFPRVGRYLFTAGKTLNCFAFGGGRITRVSNKRIYFHNEAIPADEYIHVVSLEAVCDTDEEVAMLKAFSVRAHNEATALRAMHRAEYKQFFTPQVNKETTTNANNQNKLS